MAKKPSFDATKIKEFLFHKGDRVGLGLAVAISVGLLAMGFLGRSTKPPGQSSSWAEALKKQAGDMKQKMDLSRPPEDDPKKPSQGNPEYVLAAGPSFDSSQLFELLISDDTKRRNPLIPPLLAGPKDIQVDFDRYPTLTYEVNFNKRELVAVGTNPALQLEPKHMVVVTLKYPYLELLEQFKKALRYADVDRLLESPDVPRFLGLTIYKSEVLPGGKVTAGVPLYEFDSKLNKTVAADYLDKYLRRMTIDTDNPELLKDYLGPNMVTPLPQLATITGEPGKYKPLKLSGIDVKDDDPKKTFTKNPAMNLGAGNSNDKDDGTRLRDVKWSGLPQEMQDRLEGTYNVFDPIAASGAKAGGNVAQPVDPKVKGRKKKQPNPMPQPAGDKEKEPDGLAYAGDADFLLARFFDVDLEVGKTYRYFIQVRVANPNFGSQDAAAVDLASKKELVSDGWAVTPDITVPGEYHYYLTDQLDAKHDPRVKGGNDKGPADADRAPVQIHLWVNKNKETRGVVGDWLVAERLLVHRGDVIGRKFAVEAPEWNLKKGKYELATSPGKPKPIEKVPVDFLVEHPPVLVVDFQGGKHNGFKVRGNPVADNSAIEMLVLTPDGRLVVRDSRVDSDPVSPEGRARLDILERWRDRVNKLQNTGDPKEKKGFLNR